MITSKTKLLQITTLALGTTSIYPYTLDANKTYYIKVFHESSSGTGIYSIKAYAVSDDYTNENSSATTIQLNNEMAGEINYTKDVDVFKFNPTVNGRYIIETTGSTDTLGYLYENNGYSVTSNDDANSTNKNFSINTTLTANQTYFIHVYHHNKNDLDNSGTGGYSIKITAEGDDHGNDFNSATAMQIGTETSGNIESAGDIGLFLHILHQQAEHIYSRVQEVQMLLLSYMTAVETILPLTAIPGIGDNLYIPYELEANKTYYIKLHHESSTDTGSYEIKVVYSASDDHGK